MDSKEEIIGGYKSLVPHFRELKSRISKSLLCILVFFLILFPFSDIIYNQLAEPLISRLPSGSSMIAIDVASQFFIPFKLVMILFGHFNNRTVIITILNFYQLVTTEHILGLLVMKQDLDLLVLIQLKQK